jgi:hypothetical protein
LNNQLKTKLKIFERDLLKIPRLPILSTITPKKGASPAEIKKGKLYKVEAVV